MNSLKNKFLKTGLYSEKKLISSEKCKILKDKIHLPGNLKMIFQRETDYKKNPQVRKTNPGKGVQNLAEELDLKFIEKNTRLINILESILGKKYEIILKKFIIGVPKYQIPKWILKITSKELVGNLNKFILPKYRKCTFFYGIDYHMDYIDVPNNKGNFITLYVYLDEVSKGSSPLNVALGSHYYGATKFPHNIKKLKNKIKYGKDKKNMKIFNIKTLTGFPGDVNLWSCYNLHGTSPMKEKNPRISLRYLIKSKNNKNNSLISKLRNNIKYDTKIGSTRTDIIKKKVLNKNIDYAIQSKKRILQR